MKALAYVKFGWKWLATQLNNLIDGVNARTISVPLGGGIDILETSNGTLIALSSSHALSGALAAGGTGTSGGDGSGTDLTALTDRVAALEAILATSTWTGVDVVDLSCVRTTINVLTKA